MLLIISRSVILMNCETIANILYIVLLGEKKSELLVITLESHYFIIFYVENGFQ